MRDYEDMNKNGWIKVEDRLPERDTENEYGVDVNVLLNEGKYTSVFTLYYSFDRKDFTCQHSVKYTEVIAWQPLTTPRTMKELTNEQFEAIFNNGKGRDYGF
jgi:hypothetical protein